MKAQKINVLADAILCDQPVRVAIAASLFYLPKTNEAALLVEITCDDDRFPVEVRIRENNNHCMMSYSVNRPSLAQDRIVIDTVCCEDRRLNTVLSCNVAGGIARYLERRADLQIETKDLRYVVRKFLVVEPVDPAIVYSSCTIWKMGLLYDTTRAKVDSVLKTNEGDTHSSFFKRLLVKLFKF